MNEFRKAVAAAEKWIETYGGHAVGMERQMDGRWFLRVVTNEENWCPRRNMFVVRLADLGRFDDDEEE